MSLLSSARLARAAFPVLLMSVFAAQAAPVTVQITNFSFTQGSGYGVDADENSGTLLDVVFSSAAFAAQNFSLMAVGSFVSFDVGTVNFREPRSNGSNGGIGADETDNLNVAAAFTFTMPFGSAVTLTGNGLVDVGPVQDAIVDFSLGWSGQQIAFGTGGLLGLSLNSVSFTGSGQTATQTATITLLAAPAAAATPAEPADNAVPEPGSLALAGLALTVLAVARRRPAARG